MLVMLKFHLHFFEKVFGFDHYASQNVFEKIEFIFYFLSFVFEKRLLTTLFPFVEKSEI